MARCRRCTLEDGALGVVLGPDGVCNLCVRYAAEQEGLAERKASMRRAFAELADQVRPRGGFHCLLAYSGGKDSSYTLALLRQDYGLRVLAVTIDNGFVSPQAFENLRSVAEAVDAGSTIVKPPFRVMKALFGRAMEAGTFSKAELQRASGFCNGCIGVIKQVTLRMALEQEIPLVAYGWSPGQAPVRGALFQMTALQARQQNALRGQFLRQVGREALEPYLLQEKHFGPEVSYPTFVSPMAFHDYVEAEIIERIRSLGWQAPRDTDGTSTNCLLNGFAARAHRKAYGQHPYALEVAGLVRAGVIGREEGLASLEDVGSEEGARFVATRLGVEMP